MVRFLVDAQLPPALARKLSALGHDGIHVLDVGLLDAGDGRIWDYALAENRIIVTKDEDFAIRASVARVSPTIVWLRIGNCPNARLLAWFETQLSAITGMIDSGHPLIEISA